MKVLTILATILLLASCSDDCVTCTNNTSGGSITYCDDGTTNYTDAEGNPIDFSLFIENLRETRTDCE